MLHAEFLTATMASPSTIPATRFGIISMPSSPAGPALRHHGRINDDGVYLVTFDRTRLTLDLVVEALRQAFGLIEFAVETMPEPAVSA